MDVLLSLRGPDAAAELRSLHTWLQGAPELAGCVSRVNRTPAWGELGSGVMDALAVAVGSGGAISALIPVLNGWLSRSRGVELQLHIEVEGRSADVKAVGMDSAEAGRVIRHLIDGEDKP